MPQPQYTSASSPIAFRRNNGGLNSTHSPLSVADGESSKLLNVDFDESGVVKKRKGYTRLNTSAFNSGATWNGLHYYEKADDTSFLVGTCGNKFAKMDSLDGTFDDVTGSITITAGNNNHCDFITHVDTVVGTNGVDLVFKWTGSGNASVLDGINAGTASPSITKAKFIEVFSNYTVVANVTDSGTALPSRLYWSTIDTIETWSASDFRNVGLDDGQIITGLKTLGRSLVIFKDSSIWVASFTGDRSLPFVFERTRSNVGCISGYSIQTVANGLIFLSQDGYYFFDGQNSTKISDRIRKTLNDDYSKTRFVNSVSAYLNSENRYIGSFTKSGNTTHDSNITFDAQNNAFSKYEGLNANVMAIANVSGVEKLYFGDYAGFVYLANNGNDDYPSGVRTAIESYYYTKWIDFEDVINNKGIESIVIYYRINEAILTITHSYEFEDGDEYSQTFSMSAGGSLYGTGTFDSSTYSASGGKLKVLQLTGRGRLVRIGFKNNVIGETFILDGFGLLAYLEGHK